MSATFARSLEVCLETGLLPAIVALWPDRESATAYWQATAIPLIERMDFVPVAASLLPLRGRQAPTRAFLASLARGVHSDADADIKKMHLDQAIERLLDKPWRECKYVVLCVEGLERWVGARWRHDTAAFRAVAQANQHRLFVIYICTDTETLSRLFGDVREPLYREGMVVLVEADGRLAVSSVHGSRPTDTERVLVEAELAAGGDRKRAFTWFMTERLSEFDNLTAAQLVQKGKAQVVVDYIRSIAGGPTG